MKRALITGGAGFVGRHFTRRLASDGWAVEIVDNLVGGVHPDKWVRGVPAFTFTRDNVRDFFKRTFAGNYDLIIHCAAIVGGRLNIEGAPLAVATDLAIDADFFNWLACSPSVPKIVYFSSSAVYPVELQTRARHMDLSEGLVALAAQRIGMPDQTYGWAKLTGELLAQYAVKTYGLDVVIYRPFSGYGDDQDLSYPFPAIIRRVVKRKNPLTIWGSGDQFRDFIHIDDIVEGVLSTMFVLPSGGTLNLGTGVATSFTQLAGTACCIAGSNPDIVPDLDKPEGVFYRVADTYNMRKLFSPRISLGEGVARALDKVGEKV